MKTSHHFARFAIPAAAALALAACGEAEDPNYEVDATDESGGELIVNQEDPNDVDVDLPETPMVPVDRPMPGTTQDRAMDGEAQTGMEDGLSKDGEEEPQQGY